MNYTPKHCTVIPKYHGHVRAILALGYRFGEYLGDFSIWYKRKNNRKWDQIQCYYDGSLSTRIKNCSAPYNYIIKRWNEEDKLTAQYNRENATILCDL